MLELKSEEFARVVPLLQGIPQQVVPYAVCEGGNTGRVFADHNENPRTALVWTTVGYYFLCGKIPDGAERSTLADLLTRDLIPASLALGETGFVLITPAGGWKESLPAILPQREVIEIYRRPHILQPARFSILGDWRSRIPAGFSLQRMDESLAQRAGLAPTWASVHDFMQKGLGFALLREEEIVCSCSSVFAGNGRLEIDLHTHETYRRRGLATLTAAAFIEACLEAGQQPNWECFWDNAPSCRLAQHLGFDALPDYPVYFWEEGSPAA